MKTGRTVTRFMLESVNACWHQLDEFQGRFGDKVKVTRKMCESVAQIFDWNYAGTRLLSHEGTRKFARDRAPFQKQFDYHSALLLKDLESKRAPLRERFEYERTMLHSEYKPRIAALWDEYDQHRQYMQSDPKHHELARTIEEQQIIPLTNEYESKLTTLESKYIQDCKPLIGAYNQQLAPLTTAYNRQLAILFWKWYNNEI